MAMRRLVWLGAALSAACGGGGTRSAERPTSAARTPAAEEPRPASSASAAPVAADTHAIRGRVKAIAAEHRAVTLDHEAVPGVLGPTKEYRVAYPALLDGITVGDRVHCHFEMRATGEYVITDLSKSGQE